MTAETETQQQTQQEQPTQEAEPGQQDQQEQEAQQETQQQPEQEQEARTTQQETTTYKATEQEKDNIASVANDFTELCKKADEIVDKIGISGMDEICDVVCDTMKDILKKIPEKLTEVSEDEYLNHNSRNPNEFEKFIKSTNLLKNGKKDRTIAEMKNGPKYHNNLDCIKGMEHYEEDADKDEETEEIKKNINDVQKSVETIKTDMRIIFALFVILSASMMFFH